MAHQKDEAEKWALALLSQIIACDRRDRDALPGEAIKLIKRARKILLKRQASKKTKPRKYPFTHEGHTKTCRAFFT